MDPGSDWPDRVQLSRKTNKDPNLKKNHPVSMRIPVLRIRNCWEEEEEEEEEEEGTNELSAGLVLFPSVNWRSIRGVKPGGMG